MNMKEIEAVCKIEKYRSFSEAANDLFCSPSVITNYVANIEKELDLKLFVRGNKASILSTTTEGAVMIPALKHLYIEYQRLTELAKQLNGTNSAVIRIGSQPKLSNLPEQEIFSSFMAENPEAGIEQIKMSSKEILQLLVSGKLDAAFLSLHGSETVEEYLLGLGGNPDVEIIYLTTEDKMYFGISEQYLPDIITEAPFCSFRDFTIAVSFPKAPDQQYNTMLDPFETLAKKNGFPLKTAFFGAIDFTVMKLAAKMMIAVTATNIPENFPGFKFVRVSDWPSYTNIYFVSLKSNRKKILALMRNCVLKFCADKQKTP